MWESILLPVVSISIIFILSSCQVEQSTNALDTTSGVIILVDFDHSGIVDNCISCHNGIAATDKSANHIPAPNTCETCHTVNTWSINAGGGGGGNAGGSGSSDDGGSGENTADFDHATVEGTPCMDCHNNQIKAGKPDGHPPAPDTCEMCHDTQDWDNVASGSSGDGGNSEDGGSDEDAADFDHATVEGTPCIDCHDNQTEEGKPVDHRPAPDTCEICHNTNDWDEIITAPASTISSPFSDPLILTN